MDVEPWIWWDPEYERLIIICRDLGLHKSWCPKSVLLRAQCACRHMENTFSLNEILHVSSSWNG